MIHETTPAPASRLPLALAALAIGVLTVAAVAAILSVATGQSPNFGEEYRGLLARVAMVATPFLLLALLNVRARRPWLLGVGLTMAVWGYYLFDGLRDHVGWDRASVNLAIAMLASPIVITLACLVAALVGRGAPAPAPPPSAP